MSDTNSPVIGIAMGSESDWPVMKDAVEILDSFGLACEARVLSAHRTPRKMTEYAEQAAERGIRVIIAGAGGAAHLPGMIAASTPLPVIGVPVPTRHLKGMDSLLSIVQMPRGVPVATVAIGNATNAAILAAQIVGASDPEVLERVRAYKATLQDLVADMDENVSQAARGE
jgi:5-(carboxyamino)imidazole ribonucleotide mutase